MKNSILLLLVTFLVKNTSMIAQIPNAGFENLTSSGSLSHWGNVYSFAVWLDSNGVSHGDSIVFDNQFYAAGSDAYAGTHALELRNAWNFTNNTGIAGAAACDEDSIFTSWGLLNLLPANGISFNTFATYNFGFQYKFFPVNGDSAYAELALWDSLGNQVGSAVYIISDSASSYTEAVAPITYTTSTDAAFYSLSFHNFYTATPYYRQPGFGTRLLIDAVGFNKLITANSISSLSYNNQFSIYPNPFTDKLSLELNQNLPFDVELFSLHGQLLISTSTSSSFEVSELPKGIYCIKLKQGTATYSKMLVKE